MPKIIVKRTPVYQFEELSKEAKAHAIEKNSQINFWSEWSADIVSAFKEKSEFFDITNVYFSGFYSQGDGAMFEYSGINPEFVKTIIDTLDIPNWKKAVLKQFTYVSGSGKHSGHYYHSRSVSHNIYVEADGAQNYPNIEALVDRYAEEIEEKITDKYRELADGLYSELDKENDYLSSDKLIEETLIANGYEFTEDGERYCG